MSQKSYSNLTTQSSQSTPSYSRLKRFSVEEFGRLHPEAIPPFQGLELLWGLTDGGANFASPWEEIFHIIACECLALGVSNCDGRILLTEKEWLRCLDYAHRIKLGECLRERFIWFEGGEQ